MNILNKVTLKYLYKNKVRTLVTMVGIILSTAMFTAVTTSISSFQNYMIESITKTDGAWHAAAYNLSYEEQQKLRADEELEASLLMAHQGFLQINQCLKNNTEAMTCQNDKKPYLLVGTWLEGERDLTRIVLTEGRMPQTPYEILVPKHLVTNGGVLLTIGDTITGALGERCFDGKTLYARENYLGCETDEEGNPLPGSEAESFHITGESISYTIVGFYERANSSLESYYCPGYLLLTGGLEQELSQISDYQVYYTVKHISKVFDFIESIGYDYDYHSDLLRTYGTSRDSYQEVFWGLGTILAVIILFGSVALIYNAFSISVNERVKQFGLLSSIGATKKQLKKSVLFEAVCVGGIAIPFGVLAGIAGMAVTFYCLKDSFAGIFYGGQQLHIHVEAWTIVVAVVLSFVTVIVSAWLPARRTLKISAIEAIRQNSEIKCNRKQVRTFGLVYRMFGLEGMLAKKNFKRNKRKYRATVLSLFVSIVLFVSATSFVTYLKNSVNGVITVSNYDYIYALFEEAQSGRTADCILKELAAMPELEKVSYIRQTNRSVGVESDTLTKACRDYLKRKETTCVESTEEEQTRTAFDMQFVFLPDEEYQAYLTEQGLSGIGYYEPAKEALVFDGIRVAVEEKYQTLSYLQQKSGTIHLQEYSYEYKPQNGSDGGGEYVAHRNHITDWELSYQVVEEELPFGVDNSYLSFVYPISAAKELGMDLSEQPVYLMMKAADPSAYEKVQKVLFAHGLDDNRLYDMAEGEDLERNMILILNVFSYGFITLISLIAAANVFNTISTGISLRNREFAMLESVGMTKKGFYKMLNYECLLYGIKSIMYGVPVSIGITWSIYRVITNGYETNFYMPVSSLLIAIGSVFLVVFATMFYSASKLQKHSLIETLKNENI